MVRCAMIAAVYTVVSLVLAPLTFNAVQIRFAEALCLLPVICPQAVAGVTLGCLLTNLLGSVPVDALFGTLATLVAAVAARALRNIRWRGLPVASALCPVAANALIVGWEITWFFMGIHTVGPVLFWNMTTVAIGEAIACLGLGLVLVRSVEKNEALLRLFE